MKKGKINITLKKLLGEKVKKILIIFLFPFRNRFILFNVFNKAKKNIVNLDYWSEAPNLGDSISPVIVEYMLSLKNIKKDKKISKTKHLCAVGSVLTAGIQDCTVWGSGILNTNISYRVKNRRLDIRSVRGPLTRIILEEYGYKVPNVYGDPAILLPQVFSPKNKKKIYKVGIIVHKDFILEKSFNDRKILDEIKIIDIKTNDYKKFIEDIVLCEKIVSSSLHGIIIAEAYDVPAVLLKPQVDLFKYYDYYYSTGRLSFPMPSTIEEAIITEPVNVPNLEELRKNLSESFPYDIYEDFNE